MDAIPLLPAVSRSFAVRDLRVLPRILAACIVAALISAAALSAQAEDMLSEIIENVRRNELIYQDIEAVVLEEYVSEDETVNRTPSRTPPKPGDFLIDLSKRKRIRYISQGTLFRLDIDGASTTASGLVSLDHIASFDGTRTRVLGQGTVGNIRHERTEHEDFVRPHMMLLRPTGFSSPLSTYLSGDEAMRRHPSLVWDGSHTLQNSYQGTADFEGHRCHKVWITTLIRGQANSRWELWLAEDRNYLPIRVIGHLFAASDKVPSLEGTVTELTEVKPAAWFPMAARVNSYNQRAIRETGQLRPQWHETYVVEKVSFDPQYDLAFFQTVDFPDGIPVYEVKGGRITDSYVKGAPGAPGPPDSSAQARWWPVVLSAAAVLTVLAIVIVRRGRSRRLTRP